LLWFIDLESYINSEGFRGNEILDASRMNESNIVVVHVHLLIASKLWLALTVKY